MTNSQSAARRKAISVRVAEGDSFAEVINEFKVSASTIYGACREYGVKPPAGAASAQARLPRRMFAIIRDLLYGNFMSQTDIAKKHSVSRQRVSMIAKAMAEAGIGLA